MLDPHCPICRPMLERRSDGEPLGEKFSYGYCITYDVDKARQMVEDGREIHEVPTINVAGWVSYNLEGEIFLGRNLVMEDHIDHVPDSREDPIVFAHSFRHEEGKKRRLVPIDGNHRIARAIKYKQPIVYAVVLSEDETHGILADSRRPSRKTRKKTV